MEGVLLKALLLEIPETLQSLHLTLRANRAGAGAAINAAVSESHAELKHWMPWARETMTVDQTEAHCRQMHARWQAREEIDFCFHRREDHLLVGKGGLHTIDWAVPKFEIGYWIRTTCAGRGYATEATLALVELARAVLGARRIEITSDARNAASRRVAEKAGFTLEGIRRQSRRDNQGELADSCMYARVF